MDAETGKIVTKEATIAQFTQSLEWAEVKTLFVQKVVELNDLSNLNVEVDQLAQEIQARKYATEILMDWITQVEGSNATSEQNAEVLRDAQKDEIIKILPD